jgi:hypothetical protein
LREEVSRVGEESRRKYERTRVMRVEGEGFDGAGVAGHDGDASLGADVPNSNGLIAARGSLLVNSVVSMEKTEETRKK